MFWIILRVLNPNENIWAWMGREVYTNRHRFRRWSHRKAIFTTWSNVTLSDSCEADFFIFCLKNHTRQRHGNPETVYLCSKTKTRGFVAVRV